MNKNKPVKVCNMQALHAVPRKFFSPGSMLVTVLNPGERDSAPSFPQANPDTNLHWRDFRSPWWLTERCPELGYVSKDLSNCTVLAPFLGSPPPLDIINGGFRLCRWALDAWDTTERQLLAVCDALLAQVYGMAEAKFPLDSFWPEPSRCGYKSIHQTRYQAVVAIKRSMDAFVALAARCSLAIALHSPPDADQTRNKWIEFLLSKQVPGCWLDTFKECKVATFPANSKVGCYVCPSSGSTQTRWMDHVLIMARAGLPVYIQWPPKQQLENVFLDFPWLKPLYPTTAHEWIHRLPVNQTQFSRQYFEWEALDFIPATAWTPDDSTSPGPTAAQPDAQHAPPAHAWTPEAWVTDGPRTVLAVDVVRSVDDDEQPPHGVGQRPGESFAQFSARRERENKEREAKETVEERQARLERQKLADTHTFPNRNTRMFVWEELQIYHRNVRDEWADLDYRHLLGGKMRRARWDEHGMSQRRYDAFRNEWELCKELNPEDVPYIDADSEDDYDDYVPLTAQNTNPQPHGAADAPVPPLPVTPALATHHAVATAQVDRRETTPFVDFLRFYRREEKSTYKPRLDEPTETIRNRWGVVTVHYKDEAFTQNDCHPDRMRIALGALATADRRLDIEDDVMHSLRGWAAGMAIAKASPKAPSAPESVWDLHPNNPNYLCLRQNRHPSMRLTVKWLNGRTWYMITYADGQASDWDLIVDNATTALELMRRRNIDSRKSAVRFLAERGMPFRTVIVPDPRKVLRLATIRPTVLGFRGVNAKFDQYDFSAYWSRAHDVLYPVRARAAVLRGGIVWRIAVELWGSDLISSALDGPSEDAYYTGQVYRPVRGPDYLDDHLTESEIDVICGVYHVLTGHDEAQEKHQSWWPRPNTWSGSPLDTGFWSSIAETWFQNRLSKIRAGEAQPYHVQKWRRNLNSGKVAAQVRDSVETVSADFIENYLRAPHT